MNCGSCPGSVHSMCKVPEAGRSTAGLRKSWGPKGNDEGEEAADDTQGSLGLAEPESGVYSKGLGT